MYNPWKDNFEPQNRERTESGYSSGSFAPYAAPEGGAPYTPFEQYDSNSAIYSPSVQLRFYFYIMRKWTFQVEELRVVHFELATNFAKTQAKIEPSQVINTFCMFWNTLGLNHSYTK